MYAKKSKEQLIKEYAEIGVDYNKFTKFGEMNVIVQSFAIEDHEQEEDEDGNEDDSELYSTLDKRFVEIYNENDKITTRVMYRDLYEIKK